MLSAAAIGSVDIQAVDLGGNLPTFSDNENVSHILTNNENVSSILTNNENVSSILTNNENISSENADPPPLMTPLVKW